MMTLTDHQEGEDLADSDVSTDTLIVALLKRADSRTAMRLQEVFPRHFADYQLRCNSPHRVIARDGVDMDNPVAVEKFAASVARARGAALKEAA